MRIVIAGGTGQLGTLLARNWTQRGHEVVVLARHQGPSPGRLCLWDGKTLGPWTSEIDGAQVIVNLAGHSVNCRYSDSNRRSILESRVLSTRVVGEAIASVQNPPEVWIQASTATIYSHRFDTDNDEYQGEIGNREGETPESWGFSTEVAKEWEQEITDCRLPATRRVIVRSAMVMTPDSGGVFDTLAGLCRAGLGGRSGSGQQYVSWIHGHDFQAAIDWLIENDLKGAVNLASPHPVPNSEFMETLRKTWGIRWGVPSTHWMLEIGAFFLRTETELLLKSRRVIPTRLLQSGFQFHFPLWESACHDLKTRYPVRR